MALLQRLEGLRLEAAPLAQGGFVIGHGHVSAAHPGRRITADEARALLLFDLSRLAAEIEPLVLAPVAAPQFDALLSFAFSVGTDAFARSVVLKRLNAGAALDAAAALELWRCARIAGEPQVVDVLVRRRAVEKARFLEAPEGLAATPSALLRPEEDAAVLALAHALDDGRRVRRLDGGVGEDEPAPSAALAVVAALSARLDRLMRAEPEAGRDAPAEPRPPVAEPEPEPAASEPEPEPPPVVAAPQMVEAPPAAAAVPVEPPSEPLPPAAPLGPAPTMVREKPSRSPPDAAATEPRVSLPSLRAPAFVLGALGLVLFAFAVLKTYQAPSMVWLGLGLLAVAAMVPASLHLIGPRRRDED